MDLNLDGKVGLITGGSQGLGAATARLFAAEGARLVLAARSKDRLQAMAEELRAAFDAEVVTAPQDLTLPDGADIVAAAALDTFGRIDILVNSAGSARGGVFWEIPDQVWDQSMALKFFATVRMIRAVLPTMRAQKYGRIVTIAGNLGRQPDPRMLPGAAANAALLAVTSGLAGEVAADGVLVNAVNPGPTLTPRWTTRFHEMSRQTGRSVEDLQADVEKTIPTQRFGEPEQVARIIAFLASDCATNITGTSITADGGSTKALA
ncbi:MAG: SDR family oxidoreductase [Kiloniellales bacterium]